jgi:hypothetical protein
LMTSGLNKNWKRASNTPMHHYLSTSLDKRGCQ